MKICDIYPRIKRSCLLPFAHCLVAVALLLAGKPVAAAGDPGIEDPPVCSKLTGSALKQNATMETPPFTTGTQNSYSIKNIITLSIVEETRFYIRDSFSATVKIKIEYGHSAASLNTISLQELKVSYNKEPGKKYNAKNYFYFEGAEYVKVTVLEITPAVTGIIRMDTLLLLENEIRVTRYYGLATNVQPTSFSTDTAATGADELPVSWTWPQNTGHTHTQLEWTWQENGYDSIYFVGGVLNTNLMFKSNATRIDLPYRTDSFKIPLLYGGKGKLYWRVRAVNIKRNGSRSDGPWSTLQWKAFSGHNETLNWQSSISFAEEGKRKAVIQYYDGTLRSRQTVTKDNTTNTVVTAETFYDGQGRPAVQILPVPGISTVMAYTKDLNRFSGQPLNENPAKYFDLQPVTSTSQLTPAMVSTSGATKYYSSANAEINTGANKYIPNAEGYPYTVTRYTPDATGRIMAQSGVGIAMRMGSGHETKYYYGTAAQEELDGLFGTEVGNSSHYFKNMVKDANGQMSISYADMHGRTIATALAGSTPANLLALNNNNATDYLNQNGSDITRNLLGNNSNVVKNNSIESVSSLLVPVNTAFIFRYELNPQSLQLTSCSNTPLCYDCLYDLEISITDESGDLAPTVKKFNNVSLSPDDSCSTAIPGFRNDDTITLMPGSYIIRKTLTISEASLQKYAAIYLAKSVCKTEQQIADSLKTVLINVSACNVAPPANTCKACNDTLSTLANYRTRFLNSIGNPTRIPPAVDSEIVASYKIAQRHCERLCNNTSQLLPSKRALMLADMIPYSGQYARDTGTRSMYQKFNIFIEGDTNTRPFYRIPRNRNFAKDFYRNLFTVIDPGIHPDSTTAKLKTLSRADFMQQFMYSWAEALLPYHPEYARLDWAEKKLTASYNWISTFNNTELYDSAVAKGYIAMQSDSIKDPFYTTAPSYKSDMWLKLSSNYRNGIGLYQLAIGNLFCKDLVQPVEKGDCYRQILTTHPVSSLTPDQKNQAWVFFRNLYAAVRDSQVNAYLVNTVPLPNVDTLVNQGYRVHFPNSYKQLAQQFGDEWSWYPATPDDEPDLTRIPGGTTVAAMYSSRCNGYIQLWKQTLAKCAALAARSDKDAILNQITLGMAAVCFKASNESHPYGASNVAPDWPNDGSPRSFEEVVYSVLKQYGIDTTELCNPYVIEFPKPYQYIPPPVKKVIGSFEACHCSRLSQLRDSATANGNNGSSLQGLNTYLRNKYGDTLTAVLYNSMAANCENLGKTVCTDSVLVRSAYSCTAALPCNCTRGTTSPGVCYISCLQNVCTLITAYPLTVPQPLPTFLECGYVNNNNSKCLTCTQMDSLVAQFKKQIGAPYNQGPVFTGNNITQTNIRDNIIFAKFVNYKTGFQYNWIDYANGTAIAGCNLAGNPNATHPVICGSTTLPSDTAGLALTESPCQRVINMAIAWAHEIYVARKTRLLAEFESQYRARCMAARDLEQFTVTYKTSEYHYTLYYYDMAGNLLKTVPPKGVKPIFRKTFTDSVKEARASNTVLTPAHVLATNYRYNTLGAIVAQNTPDAGTTRLWYDELGRLVVSQNAQQAVDGKYSYTLFDALGRVTEVGQKPHTTAMTQDRSQVTQALNSWINNSGGTKEQVVFTEYDVAYAPLLATYMTQQNLRNRVSYTGTKSLITDNVQYTATFYTYDIHGNVDTLLQDYRGIAAMNGSNNRFKLITYEYDLISNKVNRVSYQPGKADAFYHRYKYDAENRLVHVETSRDKIVWERDAAYTYYKHGPLARSELGHLKVQGIDYAYTLQGWLKGVNSTTITNGTFDIGKDGSITDSSVVARDVLGYALHYYDNSSTVRDYKAIGGTSAFSWPGAVGLTSLYNGNIGSISINNRGLARNTASTANVLPLVYKYRYDQLNRIVSMQAYKGLDTATNVWTAVAINAYKEAVSYDPNGNIRTYNRKGDTSGGKPLEMDALTYNYNANTNRLNYVQDTVNAANYTEDLDTQSSGNYTYDAIGNLKTDVKEGITNIAWNVYGKITGITKTGSSIAYSYDAAGNRISKIVQGDTTVYVRDGSGNVLCVYERRAAVGLQQSEVHLYGSSRLGMITKQTVAPATVSLAAGFGTATVATFSRNEKIYELTNHLGNVLATIGDKKLPHTTNDSTRDYYDADVVTATDYYPFGMTMPGRKYAANNSYRYGFNGQEKSIELNNEDSYTAEFWQYDARLGRRWNIDPELKPWESPYAVFSNNPISRVDPDGDSDTTSIDQVEGSMQKLLVKNEQLNVVAHVIEGLKKGIDEMKELFNQKVILDVEMFWNPMYWGPDMLSSLFQGDNVDKMAETIAHWTVELENQIVKFNTLNNEFQAEAAALKNILSSASYMKVGSAGLLLSKLSPIHKNSKTAQGAWRIYEIIVEGETFKFGIADAGRLRKTGDFAGLPERLAAQLSKIRKYAPELQLNYEVGPLLRMLKGDALLIESKTIADFALKYGIPLGNVAEIKKWSGVFARAKMGTKAIRLLSKFLKF
jgi:RHS repeat-associated protein